MEEDFQELHEIYKSEEVTRSYDTRYVAEIKHLGTGAFRVLKDMDQFRLDNKIEAQFKKWDDQWSKIDHKNKSIAYKESNTNTAIERTQEATEEQKEIDDLLLAALKNRETVNWNSLKDKKKFKNPNPKDSFESELAKVIDPMQPVYKKLHEEPSKTVYEPRLSFLDNIFSSLKTKKVKAAEVTYERAIADWKRYQEETTVFNQNLLIAHERELNDCLKQKEGIKSHFDSLEQAWLIERDKFFHDQKDHNKKIDELRDNYLNKIPEAVIQYCEMVLSNSDYPESFPRDFDLDYTPTTGMLIVEYVLPSPDDLPKLVEVKYISTKKELKEIFLSDVQISKNFDSAIYKITLRTLYELFKADKAGALEAIIFNGWVNATNKANGKKVNNCIVSIQAKKSELSEIELANVDPKTCFKNLKGVASSKLSGITAVQPIAQINKNDKRFIIPHEVANQLDQGFNLAAMDWEDFEHLLREIFEKEFSANGGEVKVTQASRDGGVDAVAFDPDPIRGGKIVIQAKRYTNTVGVSAVRDLYGTVMNEGATKGILVTTADYGPDAYDFAKNKPITLMNGANLLYLLEKHGHKVRIDLQEAKKILGEKLANA